MNKKLIVMLTLISSLFVVITCVMLTRYLSAVNTYGINVNRDHLFPKFEISVLDESNGFGDHKSWQEFSAPYSKPYKIVNNTDDDLNLSLSIPTSIESDNDSHIIFASNDSYFIDYNNNTFTITSIPTDYPYYYSRNRVLSPGESNQLYFSIDNYDDFSNIKDYTHVLKKGDSYAVKLS